MKNKINNFTKDEITAQKALIYESRLKEIRDVFDVYNDLVAELTIDLDPMADQDRLNGIAEDQANLRKASSVPKLNFYPSR